MNDRGRWARFVFEIGILVAAQHPALAAEEEVATIPVGVGGEEIIGSDKHDIALTWGGFGKLTVLYSHFSDGDLAASSVGRDVYLPQSIPVAASGSEQSFDFLDYDVKESRLWFKADGVRDGYRIGAYAEADFISTLGLGGNERTTNAYTFGLRRFFVTFDDWLLGQDWTTFLNLGAYPETVDFVGPTEGAAFIRQPQIRYTQAGLQVALENPETSLTVRDAATTTANTVTGDGRFPDVVVRYNFTPAFGAFMAAVLVRRLEARSGGNPPLDDDSATGVGGTFSTTLPVPWYNQGRDDVRFNIVGGRGIGRYVGFNLRDDGAMSVGSGNGIELIDTVAGYLSYRHVWNSNWRSTVVLAAYSASGAKQVTGTEVTESVHSIAMNLIWSPFQNTTFGIEPRFAERALANGDKGTMTRLQFMGRYDF